MQKLSETRNLANPHQRRVRISHRNGSHDFGIYPNLCPHPTSTFPITQTMQNANPGRYHHQPQTQPLQKTMLHYADVTCDLCALPVSTRKGLASYRIFMPWLSQVPAEVIVESVQTFHFKQPLSSLPFATFTVLVDAGAI